jgi:hypothetical protein
VSTKRIAVIVGAGWSKVAGWPDTSGILDEGAHLVTPDQAARFQRVWDAYDDWKTTAPNPSGDVFMAEVERGAVRYVGKATADSQRRRHLRKRLAELIDFGAGRPIGHRGGRYLWQIEDSDGFLVAWRQDGNPAAAENEVLRTFAGTHGSFPFANIAGPRG